MLTLNELCERLKHIDEISLMEVLEINSDEIVDRFVDKIEERIDDLLLDFEAELDEIEE
tara:strand:+ start:2038 stop:2214 length:177 start_codon:yes stop_codon:yes gene_type:complete